MTERMRRPVAGYTSEMEIRGVKEKIEVVICDDGAVFRRFAGDDDWRQDAHIPGTAEDRRLNG